jgi:hypothetical protein
MKERDYLGDLDVDGADVQMDNKETVYERCGLDSPDSGQRPMVGSCEY